MPSLQLPINDLMSSVERPVVFDIIRQLMDLTGISDKTLIRFFGEEAKAPQWGSFNVGAVEPYSNLWPHRDNLMIEVEEDFDPNHMLSIATKEVEVPYLFVDRDINFMIKPIYSPSQVTIRMIYRCADKNEAIKWRNDIRARVVRGYEVNLHRLKYSYAFPQAFEALVEHIYDLRSAVGGNGEELGQWWGRCASPKFTKVVTQAGTNPVIVVAETQGNVQGYFDFEAVPDKPTKSNEPEMWELSFGYHFKYDKPIAMTAKYPILIHQQLITELFRQDVRAQKYEAVLKQLSMSGEYLNNFTGDSQLAQHAANAGVYWPLDDDWFPLQGTVPPNTLRVFTGLTCISDEDKRSLLDLTDLGDYQLVQPVLDWFRAGEYAYLSGHASSIFQITVYEGYNVLPLGDFEVTPQLVVRATRDLDLTKLYHVRVAFNAKMVALQTAALDRLRRNRLMADLLAKAINGALTDCGMAADLRKNSLNEQDFALMGLGGRGPSTYGHTLFQTLFVQANRVDAYKPAPSDPQALDRPFITT